VAGLLSFGFVNRVKAIAVKVAWVDLFEGMPVAFPRLASLTRRCEASLGTLVETVTVVRPLLAIRADGALGVVCLDVTRQLRISKHAPDVRDTFRFVSLSNVTGQSVGGTLLGFGIGHDLRESFRTVGRDATLDEVVLRDCTVTVQEVKFG